MSPHPSVEQLQAFDRGELDEAGAGDVRTHITSCSACAALRASLAEQDEVLSRQLRHAAASPVQSLDAQLKSSGLQAADLPPDSFAGYELIDEIHRGGQGVVYRAIQRSTKRNVAIKVMKDGPFASRRDQARFEREVEVLAQLQHPSIVAIHDSGRSRGHFYFVMDYISGRPLDQWLAARESRTSASAAKEPRALARAADRRATEPLPIDDALRLFAEICAAVNAAHLRGVIHRDLKPGNILVDDQGHPHILDFGLAKWVDRAENTLATMTGQFMGSLPWASPEQAEGVPAGIDVRTDVYSLGVILFRMLTGRFPYEVAGSMREVLDRIVKTEPVRPGTIRRQIDDEVDTIVLKCLAKEPARRYQSAGELARDIRRYLDGEPIEAKRDSAFYVLRKNLRRYRVPVALALAFIILASTAAVTSFVFYRQADAQRINAENEAYIGLVGLAAKRAEEGQWEAAREALAACPPGLRRWEWGHLAHQCYQDVVAFQCSPNPRFVVFSPDDKYLVVPAASNDVQLLDTRTGRAVGRLTGHTAQVLCAATLLGPHDEQWLATGSADRTVRVWDLPARKCLGVIDGFAHAVRAVAFRPGDDTLAVGIGDTDATVPAGPTVSLWDWRSVVKLMDLHAHTCTLAVAFTPDGRQLVTGGSECAALLWDLDTGWRMRTFAGFVSDVYGVAVRPDGKRLATVCKPVQPICDDADQSWELDRLPGESRRISTHEGGTSCVAFSPNGELLATGGADNKVSLIGAENGWLDDVLQGHTTPVRALAFSADSAKLASASEDGTVCLWGISARGAFVPVSLDKKVGRALAFSPDGTRLAVITTGDLPGDRDTEAAVWDWRSGFQVAKLDGLSVPSAAIAYSHDGLSIATGSNDGVVRIWDAETGHERLSIEELAGPVVGVAFSPNGQDIVVGTANGSVGIYDLPARKLRRSLDTPNADSKRLAQLAYDPAENYIAAAFDGPNGGEARIWKADSAAAPHAIPGLSQLVALSPDGRFLAGAGQANGFSVFELPSCTPMKSLAGGANIFNLVFSPDNARLAVVVGTTVRFYDCATWRELVSLATATGDHVVFSRDGTKLATCGSGHTALVWPAFPWQEGDYPPGGSWEERISKHARGYWSDWAERVRTPPLPGAGGIGPVRGQSRFSSTKVQLRSGGLLNHQPVDATHDTVWVAPGDPLIGAIQVRVWAHRGAGGLTPVVATAVWGDRRTQFWPVEATLPQGAWHDLTVHVNQTVPRAAGTYYIVIACCGEKTGAQVVSGTNWSYAEYQDRGVAWDDGNDVGFDWIEQQFWEARVYGCAGVTALAGRENVHRCPTTIGAACVTVVVTPEAPATASAGTLLSPAALGLSAPPALQFPHD